MNTVGTRLDERSKPTPIGVALGPKEGKRKREKRDFRCLHTMEIDHKGVRTTSSCSI